MSADRFAIISTGAGGTFISLPQFGLSVVILRDSVEAFAGGFHNFGISAFGTTLIDIHQQILALGISLTHL